MNSEDHPSIPTELSSGQEPRSTAAPVATAPTALSQHSVWLHVAILIPLALLLFLLHLGAADWRDDTDTHQGVIISHIMAGDGWVLPLRNGRHLPAKPPLFAWLGALSATVRGSGGDLLDARLPSALTALAGTALVYAFARSVAGANVALWSALILITTPQFVIEARDSRVDMVFSTFLTAAFILTWRVWEGAGGRRTAALAGLCFGLAVLSKGPLALVLGVLVFGTTAVLLPPAPGWRVLLAPLPVLLSLGIPTAWYAAATVQQGMAFIRLQLYSENISRLIGGLDRPPAWYYVAPFFTVGLPWTLALPAALKGSTSALPSRPRRFLWVWVSVLFVFFSLSIGKRRVYLLPLRPALAILLAGWLVPQLARWRGRARSVAPSRLIRKLIAGGVVVGLAVAVALGVGLGGWGTAPEAWSYWWGLQLRQSPVTFLAFAVAVGAGLDQALQALWQRRIERAAYAFTATLAVAMGIGIATDAVVRGAAVSFYPLAREVTAVVAPSEPLTFLDMDDESAIALQFHLRRHVAVAQTVGVNSCIPPATGTYLMQEALWETRGCASDPAWQVLGRGGPALREHKERRLVCARYAPAQRGALGHGAHGLVRG